MEKCFKCGRDLGCNLEFMKMETDSGKICYQCFNQLQSSSREKDK